MCLLFSTINKCNLEIENYFSLGEVSFYLPLQWTKIQRGASQVLFLSLPKLDLNIKSRKLDLRVHFTQNYTKAKTAQRASNTAQPLL